MGHSNCTLCNPKHAPKGHAKARFWERYAHNCQHGTLAAFCLKCEDEEDEAAYDERLDKKADLSEALWTCTPLTESEDILMDYIQAVEAGRLFRYGGVEYIGTRWNTVKHGRQFYIRED